MFKSHVVRGVSTQCHKSRCVRQTETAAGDKEEKYIKYKGTMSYKTFVWQFLVHLGLGIPINDMDREPRTLVTWL